MRQAHIILIVLIFLLASCHNKEEDAKRLQTSLAAEIQYGKSSFFLSALRSATPESLKEERLISVFVSEDRAVLIAYWICAHNSATGLRLKSKSSEFEQNFNFNESDRRELDYLDKEGGVIYSFGRTFEKNSEEWKGLCKHVSQGDVTAKLAIPPKAAAKKHLFSAPINVEFYPARSEGDRRLRQDAPESRLLTLEQSE